VGAAIRGHQRVRTAPGRNDTLVIKLFLHLSKEEQTSRLAARLDDPEKYWKFSSADLAERAYFDDYTRAYEAAISATSTKWAPWYVVPADHKYESRAIVGGILAHCIEALHLELPKANAERLDVLAKARHELGID
jgi:polyphosphate kinase 2 (PPK2 family)